MYKRIGLFLTRTADLSSRLRRAKGKFYVQQLATGPQKQSSWCCFNLHWPLILLFCLSDFLVVLLCLELFRCFVSWHFWRHPLEILELIHYLLLQVWKISPINYRKKLYIINSNISCSQRDKTSNSFFVQWLAGENHLTMRDFSLWVKLKITIVWHTNITSNRQVNHLPTYFFHPSVTVLSY